MLQKASFLLMCTLALLVAGCNDAVYVADREALLQDARWYAPAKQCSSPTLDVNISVLRPAKRPLQDMWQKDVRIEIIVRPLSTTPPRETVTLPLTMYWYHEALYDPKTGNTIPRTFTDFPSIFSQHGLESKDVRAREDIRREYMEFYKTVK